MAPDSGWRKVNAIIRLPRCSSAGPGWVSTVRDDALERSFIFLGFAAFALLMPLAATSNQAAMRALGRDWRRLHMLTYVIAILAIVHFWIQMKVGDSQPLPHSLLLATLLASRLQDWRRGNRSAGVEVKER